MEKKIFKIEVGNIPEEDIDEYVRKVAESMKKLKEIPEGELPDFRLPESDITYASDYEKRNCDGRKK